MGDEVTNHSTLLTIPLEIRNQIYGLILGGKVILFILTPGSQLRHCLCPAKGQKFHFIRYTDGDGSWSHCGSHHEPVTYERLPLLLTCRQMYVTCVTQQTVGFSFLEIFILTAWIRSYSEAASILWADNTVHLQLGIYPRFRILSHLRATLPSYAFTGIRSLEISCLHGIQHKEQALNKEWLDHWDGMWNVVKIMEGLLDLRVWVKLDQDVTVEQEARLFKPLMNLRIRNFKLEVTWPATEGSEDLLLQAPFSLIRNNNPVQGKPELAMEIVSSGPL